MNRVLRCLIVIPCLLAVAGCQPAQHREEAWSPDSIPEAYSGSVAALSWPGATRAYQVTPAGDLYNGAWLLAVAPRVGGLVASVPRRVAYEHRWCPVVRWTRYAGPVRWDFEAVALPEPAPGLLSPRGAFARHFASMFRAADRRAADARLRAYSESRIDSLLARVRRPLERDPTDRSNLFVSLRIMATNEDRIAHDVELELAFRPPAPSPPYLDPDSLVRVPWESCWAGRSAADSVLGCGEGARRGAALVGTRRLVPGGQWSQRYTLPVYPVRASDLRSWSATSHGERVTEARSFWTKQVERGARFEVPDPEVQSALRAARVLLLSSRERRGAEWAPIGGPFHYRDIWLRDGARVMQALAISGYTTEARQLAASFLQFQWPHGPFTSQTGQLDGIGQALWAFEQVLLRPGPDPSVRRFAGPALRAWRYVERQRSRTDIKHAGFVPGMLPFTDPHDAELVNAQLVGNDAWAIVGYRACERLLRAAGMNREADSVLASRSRYADQFRSSLAHTGSRDVPPSWQRRGLDWGNLAVGYPCAALPASDPHLDVLAHRYWAPLGGAGLGWYASPELLHGYVAMDMGTWALLAGQRAVADSVLDAALLWRSASGGTAETFFRRGSDYGLNFPPHPTAAAGLIALVRNMLVFDDADTLQLTLGARERWWQGTAVTRAPTRWGLLDLEFARRGMTAEWRWTPVPVWTALSLPPGTVLAGAPPPGLSAWSPSIVLAPPRTSRARLALAPASPSSPLAEF